MAVGDSPALFRENIQQLLEAWGGSPPPIQPYEVVSPALHAGVVQLRCFINNICPFTKSPLEENGFFFSPATLDKIRDRFRNGSNLTYTPGLDGIHFRPKYVFRHNYIFEPDFRRIGQATDTQVQQNWSKYYLEVEDSRLVEGARETRYLDEQAWIVQPSVFDGVTGLTEGSPECVEKTKWRYESKTLTKSQMTNLDIEYDYKKDYCKDNIPSKTNTIKGQVQVPVQTSVYNDKTNEPVHWRLMKKTPLFRGEDFFIKFYKEAKRTTSNTTEVTKKTFLDDDYGLLDINNTKKVTFETRSMPLNNAVAGDQLKETEDYSAANQWDLYTQAYYVIELGYGSRDENYFILITERNPPTFIMRDAELGFSRALSNFNDLEGEELINANEFTITVRNHLGRIAIYFSGPGLPKTKPWIISRTNWYLFENSVTNEMVKNEQYTSLYVPRGRMTLWGGNLKCGFSFGPLQYSKSHISFVYPPKNIDEVNDQDEAFATRQPSGLGEGYFVMPPFWLPRDGTHALQLTVPFAYQQDLPELNDVQLPGQQNKPILTQDAQVYREYREGLVVNTAKRSPWTYGAFFRSPTLKEFSDSTDRYVKPSAITVRKFKHMIDNYSRKVGFNILVGMATGDHAFTDDYWWELKDPMAGVDIPKHYQFKRYNNVELNDDEWILTDCKTPVLTMMRHISYPSVVPRWNDGTTINNGISKTPFDGQSPHFIDATDHVMNYSETWSTSSDSWAEVEHTATIHFYLNPGMDTVEANVSDALASLQNKSFYIEIWAGYRDCNYCRLDGLYKVFTGICNGANIDYEYGKIVMSCKIEDYKAVLKGHKFVNSPWFDGMKDISAVNEIMRMASFREVGKYDPNGLISALSTHVAGGGSQMFFTHFTGRLFKMDSYALPSGYNRLQQPGFRFKAGENLLQAINKMATKAGKTFYFDEFGIAHYENMQDIIEADYRGIMPMIPIYHFTTNPNQFGGQMVLNKVERGYDVAGIFNHIKLLTNTTDMRLIAKDAINWPAIENPEAEGFAGYRKQRIIFESMFGSKAAAWNALIKYRVTWRPKVIAKFQTFGVPLRANDIVAINNEVVRISRVTHSIDAKQNKWWMELECMRYQPINVFG